VKRRETFRHLPGLPLYSPSGWVDEAFSQRLHDGIGSEDPDWNRVFPISWYSVYPGLLANVGTLRSDAQWPVTPPAAVPATSPSYRGELYLESGEGRVRYLAWSPDRLVFRATLTRPSRVIVNQDHDDGWSADVGRVVSASGLLAVDLDAGSHDVELTYMPRLLALGFAISLGSMASAALIALYLRRRR